MTAYRDFLDEHGWVVIKGVLSSDDVHRLSQAYDALIDPENRAPSRTDVFQLTEPHLRHRIFAENLQHPGLWKLVTKTLNWSSAQLLQDVLLFRTAPSSGRVEWHCDHTYTAFLNPPILASVRVALTHSRPVSGCLHVVDKSHTIDRDFSSDIFGSSIHRGVLEELSELRDGDFQPDIRAIELEPGDISIHHSKTLHASFENHTAEEQKVIVHHIFDARCRLDPTRLPSPDAMAHFPVTPKGQLDTKRFPILG